MRFKLNKFEHVWGQEWGLDSPISEGKWGDRAKGGSLYGTAQGIIVIVTWEPLSEQTDRQK